MQVRRVIGIALLGAACRQDPPPPRPVTVVPVPPDAAPDGLSVDTACAALNPVRDNVVLGRLPRPAFGMKLPAVDGGLVGLRALRGKVVLLAFESTWDGMTPKERPTYDALASVVGDDLVIVRVVSPDRGAPLAGPGDPPGAPRVIADPPPDDANPVGPISRAWGVEKVPETILIDRAGVARVYLQGGQDWTRPDAQACVRALLAEAPPSSPPGADAYPPLVLPAPAAPPPPPPPGADDHVAGTISIDPALARGVKRGTVVFVLARRVDQDNQPIEPPVAIARLAWNGAPLAFRLSDADTMLPDQHVAGPLMIEARVDRDGDALTHGPDDLIGRTLTAAGADHVRVVVAQKLPP